MGPESLHRSARVAMMLSWVAIVVGVSGCASPPPERYFTLVGTSAPATTAAAAGFSPATATNLLVITIGPVTVPEIVDRPQLVLRTGPNRVGIMEQARWAAPLKSEIPKVIADHLAKRVPGAQLSTSIQRGSGPPDLRVAIDIERFDTVPGEGAAIEAIWTVRMRNGTVHQGHSRVFEAAGAEYEALVAAHSRALHRISLDIASVIDKAQVTDARGLAP